MSRLFLYPQNQNTQVITCSLLIILIEALFQGACKFKLISKDPYYSLWSEIHNLTKLTNLNLSQASQYK